MPSPPSSKSPQRLIPLWEGRPLLIATGLFLTLCMALLLVFGPRFIRQTGLRLYDSMLDERMSHPKTTVPVLVGIDDDSLKAYGQWPWPRYRLARLVRQLQKQGAEVIALDFLMPEPDRTSPEVLAAERERELATPSATLQPVLADSNSRKLADSLAEGNTILGYYFDFSASKRNDSQDSPRHPAGMIVAGPAENNPAWPGPTGLLRSMPVLTAAAGSEGFTNAHHDDDGVLRRVPLLLKYHGKYSPSLALGAILLASKERGLRVVDDGSETVLAWNGRHIPLDRSGNLMIDFRRGNKAFPYISAKDVLRGNPVEGGLRGKIVLVGAWALGLGDLHQVPSGLSLNGLEVHATIIDNILSGSYLSRPNWAAGAELFAILLLGVLSTWMLSRSGFAFSLLTVAAGSGGCYLAGKELLVTRGIFVSPLLPMLTPLVVLTFLSLLKYGIEARKVHQRNRDLLEAQDAIIISMTALAEARDEDTGGHIQRTQKYVEILARQLATLPRYDYLDENSIDLLAKSAPLHDIGKVGIPDYILLKPGPLTEEEYVIMQSHTLIGARALSRAIDGMTHPDHLDFLHYARQMAESHHEKWDGSGYPHGLSGTDIPLAGRLMALADVYDAIICERVYKRTFSHDEARKIILKLGENHFDPEVLDAFVAKNDEFISISRKFADERFADLQTLTSFIHPDWKTLHEP